MAEDNLERKAREKAVAALDKIFGMGAVQAHQKIRTDPITQAIYECALIALTEAYLELRP